MKGRFVGGGAEGVIMPCSQPYVRQESSKQSPMVCQQEGVPNPLEPVLDGSSQMSLVDGWIAVALRLDDQQKRRVERKVF